MGWAAFCRLKSAARCADTVGVMELRHRVHILFLGGLISLAALTSGCGASAAPEADCNGTNGNAAVAACHPDVDEIQEACPDNSNGEEYAAPTDACLQAVRQYG